MTSIFQTNQNVNVMQKSFLKKIIKKIILISYQMSDSNE